MPERKPEVRYGNQLAEPPSGTKSDPAVGAERRRTGALAVADLKRIVREVLG